MIRHHDNNAEVELDFVVIQAAVQHTRAHILRKYPPAVSAECDEVLMVINLEVRKLPTIKSLRHGSKMWGQPPSAVRRSEAPLCMVGQDGRNAYAFLSAAVAPSSTLGNAGGECAGELRSPGQPRAAVPTLAVARAKLCLFSIFVFDDGHLDLLADSKDQFERHAVRGNWEVWRCIHRSERAVGF